jgi:hypothetical protein
MNDADDGNDIPHAIILIDYKIRQNNPIRMSRPRIEATALGKFGEASIEALKGEAVFLRR